MIIDELAVPDDLQDAGAWVEVPGFKGITFKVRPLWNFDYRRLYTKLVEAVPAKERLDGRLDPEREDAITGECVLKTVLLDWSGLESAPGVAIPFSKEKAREFIFEPKYVKIRRLIMAAAGVVEDRGKESAEAAAKN